MKNAVIYCRVSSQVQMTEGSSLESQEAGCRSMAERLGYTVSSVVKEVFSGAYFYERPLLTALRSEIKKGQKPDAIFIHAVDRLSRNVAHLAIMVDDLERYGVELHCVTESFDKSAEGSLLRSVKAYVAEIEREKIRERTMRGRKSKVASGKFVAGMSPYGYRFDQVNHRRVVIEEEAEVIRGIYKAFLGGQSTYQIANDLTDAGVVSPGRKSTLWHHTATVRILKNEIYAGESHAFKFQKITKTVNRRRTVSVTLRDRSEWIDLPDLTPAIIAPSDFAQVQLQFTAIASRLRRRVVQEYLLRQRVICGVCGRKMRGETDSRTTWKAYRCVARIPSLKCGNTTLRAKDIEPVVWSKIVELIRNPDAVRELYEERVQRISSLDALTGRVSTTKEALTRSERSLSVMKQRITSLDDSMWEMFKLQLEAKVAEVEDHKMRHRTAVDALKVRQLDVVDFTGITEYIKQLDGAVDAMTFNERARVVNIFGVKVLWTQGKPVVSMSVVPTYEGSKLELVSDDDKRIEL